MIDEFIDKLSAFLESGEQKQVYEFGTYLMPLQNGEKV
jgi:hypothetical protein